MICYLKGKLYMRRNILADKRSSSPIIIGMLCLLSIVIVSCDDMGSSMVPEDNPTPDTPQETHIVDTIDYIKALHTKREELQVILAKEINVEVVSFPDRLVIQRLNIAKPLDSIDQWIHDVNTTEIIKALNEDLKKLQQDIAAARNEPTGPIEPEPDPEPVIRVEPEPDPEPVVRVEPEPDPEPVIRVEPEPDPEPVVRVEPEPVIRVEPEPDPVIPQVGDEIIVRNTLDDGIRIRKVPWGDRIGGMFDGETGIVISGPRESRGLTWVEIKWDAPVKNPLSGCGIPAKVCIGWSAVFFKNGTHAIHKRK